MNKPFKSKMSLDDLQKCIDKKMDGKAIMEKFDISHYTLKDKSFDLAKRENNISYCIDVPSATQSYQIKVTETCRLSLPKSLLEYENVKPETKFVVVFDKEDILLRKIKPATKSKKK